MSRSRLLFGGLECVWGGLKRRTGAAVRRSWVQEGARRYATRRMDMPERPVLTKMGGFAVSGVSLALLMMLAHRRAIEAGDGHGADQMIVDESTDEGTDGMAASASEKTDEDISSTSTTYRLADVALHNSSAPRQYITYGTSVYDITDFIAGHPGGPIILNAAGGSIDKYWELFSIHQQPHVHELLAQYKIGTIDPRDLIDGQVPSSSIKNPFSNDPPRDARLSTLTEYPRNAETPAECLTEPITPTPVFYVRNHFWVPDTTADTYRLTIELLDGTEKTYSLSDLHRFPQHTITATLQCAGNRRTHMSRLRPTNGLKWTTGGISTATWTGALLSDVLHDAGHTSPSSSPTNLHAHFTAAESYAASIPLRTALDPSHDVLLAHTMNSSPLPRDHGAPLRVIVPGTVAARSVKWVNRIAIADEECASQWQRRDYKCFGPNVGMPSPAQWDAARSIQEMPVTSCITAARAERGRVWVSGYAYSGGGREVVRVDVSLDGGESWGQADLLEGDAAGEGKEGRSWMWKLWRFEAEVKGVERVRAVVKATDEAYNTQPERMEGIWNARGNLANAWHAVDVDVEGGGEQREGSDGAV